MDGKKSKLGVIMEKNEEQQLTLFEELENNPFAKLQSNDWKWSFKDYPKQNGLKVFSCFSCGGGSTMGYKLAGCEVIGNCEIDPKMNELYIQNHHPKYSYLMDIREFNKKEDLPDELFNLDILDGSPPCTTFSVAGLREKTWGKKKKYAEGQAEQTLDDLSFIFIETVAKLKPKVVLMENVEGLTFGNAWEYVQKIYSNLKQSGYKVCHWICKGENMGIPQARHRFILIAIRNDLNFDPSLLDMSFDYEIIPYGVIKSGNGGQLNKQSKTYKLLNEVKNKERSLSEAHKRLYGKRSWFNSKVIYDDEILTTLRAKLPDIFRYDEKTRISEMDVIHSQTFPEDYNFIRPGIGTISYVCGMSVPPIMIKRIVTRLIESGVFHK